MTMVLLMAAPAFVFAQQAVGQSSDNTLTITVKGVSFKMIRVQCGSPAVYLQPSFERNVTQESSS